MRVHRTLPATYTGGHPVRQDLRRPPSAGHPAILRVHVGAEESRRVTGCARVGVLAEGADQIERWVTGQQPGGLVEVAAWTRGEEKEEVSGDNAMRTTKGKKEKRIPT